MKTRYVIICFACVLLGASCLYAGSSDRIGTAGAQELRIPIGGRTTAMGGSNIADVYGSEALYWNPAGVSHHDGTEAMFSHLEYMADINIDYFGVMTNLEDFGTIGFQAKVISIGDIPRTTTREALGTGEMFSPTFSVVGVTYSRVFTDRVSFGVTANYVNEAVEQVAAHGISFDVGVMYDPLWQGLRFGITMKNFGPNMKFEGEGFNVSVDVPGTEPGSKPKNFRSQSSEFELPAYIKFGVSWDMVNQDLNKAVVTGAFQANNFSEDEFRGGLEYSYDDMFFLRGGYSYSNQESYMYGLSVGGGIKYAWGQNYITLDYTWVESEYFDNNQYFTAKFSF